MGLHGFRLQPHLGPRPLLALMVPHVEWAAGKPKQLSAWSEVSMSIASFYSYAAVVKQ